MLSYEERSLSHQGGTGANAQALAIVELNDQVEQHSTFGLGVHDNIVTASIHAIIACVNRLQNMASTNMKGQTELS